MWIQCEWVITPLFERGISVTDTITCTRYKTKLAGIPAVFLCISYFSICHKTWTIKKVLLLSRILSSNFKFQKLFFGVVVIRLFTLLCQNKILKLSTSFVVLQKWLTGLG